MILVPTDKVTVIEFGQYSVVPESIRHLTRIPLPVGGIGRDHGEGLGQKPMIAS